MTLPDNLGDNLDFSSAKKAVEKVMTPEDEAQRIEDEKLWRASNIGPDWKTLLNKEYVDKKPQFE